MYKLGLSGLKSDPDKHAPRRGILERTSVAVKPRSEQHSARTGLYILDAAQQVFAAHARINQDDNRAQPEQGKGQGHKVNGGPEHETET